MCFLIEITGCIEMDRILLIKINIPSPPPSALFPISPFLFLFCQSLPLFLSVCQSIQSLIRLKVARARSIAIRSTIVSEHCDRIDQEW